MSMTFEQMLEYAKYLDEEEEFFDLEEEEQAKLETKRKAKIQKIYEEYAERRLDYD